MDLDTSDNISKHNDENPLLDTEQSQTIKMEAGEGKETKPTNLNTLLVSSLIAFLLGSVQTLPLAILLPDSINLGLTTAQAELILSTWSISSILSSILQPILNRISNTIYLLSTGIIGSLGFFSFYFSSWLGTWYVYVAITARFISGTAFFLINNKAGVVITSKLRGDISKSLTLWEIFSTAGQAAGAYLGSLVRAYMSFSNTMLIPSALLFLTVTILLLFCQLGSHEVTTTVDRSGTTRDMYLLHVSRDMIVFLWLPLLCTGAAMVFVEGNLTEFYRSVYSKSLQFGGLLLGVSGVVYCFSAAAMGIMRAKWPILTLLGLVVGLVGGGVCLTCLGPLSVIQFQPLYLSTAAFNLLLVSSAAIQLNSMTVAANCMKKSMSSEMAMSVTMNITNLSYNIGAFLGPAVGGLMLADFGYKNMFACGAPFFLVTAIVVSTYSYCHVKNYGGILLD